MHDHDKTDFGTMNSLLLKCQKLYIGTTSTRPLVTSTTAVKTTKTALFRWASLNLDHRDFVYIAASFRFDRIKSANVYIGSGGSDVTTKMATAIEPTTAS